MRTRTTAFDERQPIVEVDVIDTHAYSCHQCGSKATWDPQRQGMACVACATVLDLPAPALGPVPLLPLVERLRDSPENRGTWTPSAVTAPCPACDGPVTFPVNNVSTTCAGCGTPLVRGATPDDAPLAPGGVLPFTVWERNAEDLLRGWAGRREGGGLGRARIDVTEVRREYVPYWEFSAHVHCPYRGEYERTTRDGQVHRRAFGGTIDETYAAFGRGFSHLPTGLLRRLEPMSLDAARPYDPRYLAGAIVQQDTRGLWGAWDMARHTIDAEVDAQLKAAGDGETLPAESWPTWSRHQGRQVLVPLYVFTCRALDKDWTALVHGVSGDVVGYPPITTRARLQAWATLATMVIVAVFALWWLLPRLLPLIPVLLRAYFLE